MQTYTILRSLKFLSLFLAIVSLFGCQTRQVGRLSTFDDDIDMEARPVGPVGQYKVALLVPLSGQHSRMGKSLQQAAEMSLFDMGDSSMNLIPLDTKGTTGGAKEAARQALEKDVDLILGPVFSQNARHIKPLLERSRVPVVTYSTDLSLAEPGFFVFGFDVIEQIRDVMKYAAGKGVRSIVAIIPNNQYGRVIEQELDSLDSLRRVQVMKVFKYDNSDRNFSSIAQQIKTLRPQGIFVPEGGSQLTMILSSLQYHDLDLANFQLLGTGQWDHPQVLHHKGAVGGWFANPSMEDRVTFETRYQRTYGEEPHRLASLAYDTISMAAMMIRMNGSNPFTIASMTSGRGFVGADGLFRLLPNGDTERSLAVFRVRPGAIELIQPANRSW